jgi:SH3 domain-containing protein
MKRLLFRLLPRLLPIGLMLAVTAAVVPAAAQQVTLERDSPLYSEPSLDSAPVTQLKQGSSGEVLGKQGGGWLNLKTPGGTGWLFTFNVRFPSQKPEGGDAGSGSALGQVFGPRRSASVTSTIGVRGLEEEDLKQASFNAGQMKQLDDYAVSKRAAEQGARAAGLAPAKVDYLDGKQ